MNVLTPFIAKRLEMGTPGPGQAGSPQGGAIALVSATCQPSRF